ncbi:hypothetical protein [Sandaracinus amylolyticus]|uniref:Uncharacterized protein n=1 Tax=Sandaracinus amylolyticus TaxID=927083 RepID=A0A0F6W9P2_9BACT|nr:hypothetical protein [Sandaracinus amylolyticus]AKF11012.1 hypothetical protein DB32_008161 [Sandaracinus amylolyticus]
MSRRLLLAAAGALAIGTASASCVPATYGYYGSYGYGYPYARSVYYGAAVGVGPYYGGYRYGYPAYPAGYHYGGRYGYPYYGNYGYRSYAPSPVYRAPVEAYRPGQVAPPVHVSPPPAVHVAPGGYGGGGVRAPVHVTPPRPR